MRASCRPGDVAARGASRSASAQAANILSRAADAARHQSALTPKPSRFIYLKLIGRSAAIGNGDQITMQGYCTRAGYRSMAPGTAWCASSLARSNLASPGRPGLPERSAWIGARASPAQTGTLRER